MFDSLPPGWTVWADEDDGRSVLAYRPDVFDGQSFPAPCLPTIYVTSGDPRRRPAGEGGAGDAWQVRLYLEPEVSGPERRCDTRDEAREAAVEVAAAFAAGEVDYRALYQVPREAYLDRLDELIRGD